MKAFFVGLLALFVIAILAGLGVLLYPFLIVLGLFVRIILIGVLLILATWLLGKFIVYLWRKMRGGLLWK